MATEYAFMVNTFPILPEIADATDREISQSIGGVLGPLGTQLSKAIPEFQGGGWEIVSHDLTRIDFHLAVTLLLRRESTV